VGEVTVTEKMVRRHEYTTNTSNKGTMGTRKGEDLTTTHGSQTPGGRPGKSLCTCRDAK
jgi:hypothetical protein